MKRSWTLLSAALAALSLECHAALGCPAAPAYRLPAKLPWYQLSLRVQPENGTVAGTLAVSFAPERETDRLVFRLWPNGPRLSGYGAGLTVGAVTEGGSRLQVAHPNRTTLVVFAVRPVAAGQRIRVSMPWHLRLPHALGERLSQIGSLIRLGSFFPLLAWNGHSWALDPPSTGPAEVWTSPAADFDVRISAPRELRVLSSGERVGRGHWRAHAVRDFALVLGHFRTATAQARAPGRVKVTVGVAGSKAPAPQLYAARAVKALEAHSRRFGPYPWRTMSIAVLPDLRGGGIEYPTIVFEGPQALFRATSHELGHQWFYSLVGNDQARDPWLDETFATWAAGRADHILPFFTTLPIPAAVRGHLGAPMGFWDRHLDAFFAGAYAQGVRALATLGSPARVDCALRQYVARNAYRTATPRDLLAALVSFFPDARRKLASFGARF